MAVQNALVQIAVAGSLSTADMTTNPTCFATDLGEVLPGAEPCDRSESRVWGMAHRGRLPAAVSASGACLRRVRPLRIRQRSIGAVARSGIE